VVVLVLSQRLVELKPHILDIKFIHTQPLAQVLLKLLELRDRLMYLLLVVAAVVLQEHHPVAVAEED